MGDDTMGMSDKQFEVFTDLINFIDELIDDEENTEKRKALKERKKNILANNKPINQS